MTDPRSNKLLQWSKAFVSGLLWLIMVEGKVKL